MFKYVLTLLACAALLYQTSAGAASMSSRHHKQQTTKVEAHQLKNNKLTYHPQTTSRKTCKYNDKRCHQAQQKSFIRKCHANAGRGGRRDGNFERGNNDERGGDNMNEGRSYNRSSDMNDSQPARDFNGARDFPGESNSEESFLGDHR